MWARGNCRAGAGACVSTRLIWSHCETQANEVEDTQVWAGRCDREAIWIRVVHPRIRMRKRSPGSGRAGYERTRLQAPWAAAVGPLSAGAAGAQADAAGPCASGPAASQCRHGEQVAVPALAEKVCESEGCTNQAPVLWRL